MLTHQPKYGLLEKICLIFFCAWILLFFYQPIETEDIWWHLATGQWIFTHHQIPKIDIFSFDDSPSPWILTQWLGSCFYYLIYKFSGLEGLKFFRPLMFCAIIFLFYSYARRRIPSAWLFPLLILMVFGLASRDHLRPFLFNFIFIQIYLIILFQHHHNPSSKRIFALPFLSIIWLNFHTGAFIYGSILIGVLVLYNLLQWIQFKNSSAVENAAVYGRQKFISLTIVLVGHALAFLINPYGMEGVRYLVQTTLVPNNPLQSVFADRISELLPPGYIFTKNGIWVFVFCALTIFCLTKLRRQGFVHLLLFAISLLLFFYANRGSSFFTIICCYVIADTCFAFNAQAKWNSIKHNNAYKHLVILVCLIFLSALITRSINQRKFYKGAFVSVLNSLVDNYNTQPVLDFLDDYQITQGNLFATDGYGGYLVWKLYPRFRIFMDGRQANFNRYIEYVQATTYPEQYWSTLDEKYGFDVIILSAFYNKGLIEYLLEQPDWTLILVKELHVVFVKKDNFNLSQHLAEYKSQLRAEGLHEQTLQPLPAKSASALTTINNFINPPANYIDELEQGMSLFDLKFLEAGANTIRHAYDQTHAPGALSAFHIVLDNFLKLDIIDKETYQAIKGEGQAIEK